MKRRIKRARAYVFDLVVMKYFLITSLIGANEVEFIWKIITFVALLPDER